MLEVRQQLLVDESVICAELDGELVLLHVRTGSYFGLNALGTQIWALLANGADEDTIIRELLHQYDVTPATLRADVTAFLSLLVEKGLAHVSDR
jgi:hypothetical protein